MIILMNAGTRSHLGLVHTGGGKTDDHTDDSRHKNLPTPQPQFHLGFLHTCKKTDDLTDDLCYLTLSLYLILMGIILIISMIC